MQDIIIDHYIATVARGALDMIAGEAGALVLRYTVPLYSDNGSSWEPAGSGVLARVHDRDVLLTAKHCVDGIAAGETELLVVVDRDVIRVPTIEFAWPVDPKGELDACALLLPSESLAVLRRLRLTLDLARPVVEARTRGDQPTEMSLLVGFPGKLNKTDYAEGRVQPGPIAITGSLRTATKTSTLLVFDARTSDQLPHLDGVSGSGIWIVRCSRKSEDVVHHVDELELVGIGHTHHENKLSASPLAPVRAAAEHLVRETPL